MHVGRSFSGPGFRGSLFGAVVSKNVSEDNEKWHRLEDADFDTQLREWDVLQALRAKHPLDESIIQKLAISRMNWRDFDAS